MRPEVAVGPGPDAGSEFLETAASLGRRLCRDALWHEGRCNWLGQRMEPVDGEWQVVLAAGGGDLYAGTAGIALFLARLWARTGEALVGETARAALRQAASRRDDLAGNAGALGFHGGLSGVAWAAAQVAEALDDDEAAALATSLAEALAECPPSAGAVDVIGGSAGAIPACLDLAAWCGRPRLAQRLAAAAARCGEHLLASAHASGDGALSWDTLAGASPRHLTGFAHGAGGIAWALQELAHATGDRRYDRAATAAVRYEQACFDPVRGNWPDFRDPSTLQGAAAGAAAAGGGEPAHAMAWCHGAPGIGLGRLRGWRLSGDEELLQHARSALATTAASLGPLLQGADGVDAEPHGNFSLCHGHSGNAALAVYAAQVLGEAEPLELARAVGRAGIERFHRPRAPWPCGVPGAGETPGLMTGLAGIGYFYLRLHDPHGVPPVLIPVPRGEG